MLLQLSVSGAYALPFSSNPIVRSDRSQTKTRIMTFYLDHRIQTHQSGVDQKENNHPNADLILFSSNIEFILKLSIPSVNFAKNSTQCYMKSAKVYLGNCKVLTYYSSCSFIFLYVQILAYMLSYLNEGES